MNTTDAIRARRSVRQYQPGHTIPQDHIDLMLEAAMSAPSARNSRPWEFVVVENADTRQRITQVHPYCRSLPDASLGIVVCGIPNTAGEDFWPQDCAAATENLLLQATELGYGTCWCGIYPDKERSLSFANLLGVTSTPMALIIIGIADESPARRGFLDQSRVRYLR